MLRWSFLVGDSRPVSRPFPLAGTHVEYLLLFSSFNRRGNMLTEFILNLHYQNFINICLNFFELKQTEGQTHAEAKRSFLTTLLHA
jgi:hypothetical protein